MKGIYDIIFVLYHLQFLIFGRSDAEYKEKSWVDMENKLNYVYENKYGKQLDHKIPLDHQLNTFSEHACSVILRSQE